jgi:O-antigen/teichoic acid export membrane protein
MRRDNLTQAAAIAGGQALTALGTVAGVRVLTQFLAPQTFGVVSLALGASTLLLAVVCTPFTQAAMHFYPRFAAREQLDELRFALARCLRQMAYWVGPILLGLGAGWAVLGAGSRALGAILLLLFVCDCWRSAELSMLNAARRQGRYSGWMAADAWARPALATAAVLTAGPSAGVVLGAYLVAAAGLIACFGTGRYKSLLLVRPSRSAATRDGPSLDRRMWRYALPLIPIGLLGWVTSLGDRYIIGGLLSVAQVGAYAAVYGVSSAPFMIVGGTIEQALRPVHQSAVAFGRRKHAQRLFYLWLGGVAGVCATGVLLLALFHEQLASILLGRTYRHAAYLMPWIGAGYGLRACSYVFERVCYAYGRTRRVLVAQACAAVAALAVTPIAVWGWGLRGAGAAVPVCFALQLAVAVVLARRTEHEQAGPAVDAAGVIPIPGGGA